MSNQGWIKLHRKMLDNPIMTSGDSYLLQLWIHLLLSVNAIEKRFLFNGDEMLLRPGQGIFGLNQIVKDCTIYKDDTTTNFKRCKTIYYRRLKILEKLGNVKLQPTNKFTVITITNWNIYQSNETQAKLQRNSSETPVLTNKNNKNNKNEEKRIISKDITKPIGFDSRKVGMDVFASKGNAAVSSVIARLEQHLGAKLDGSVRNNRNFASHLLKKYTHEQIEAIFKALPLSKFWAGKITSTQSLYNHASQIINSLQDQGGKFADLSYVN